MRREAAVGGSPGKLLTLLMWSYASVTLEGMHPYQGGYFRRKYRLDRRPTLPVESPWAFYPRYLGEIVSKHYKLARTVLRYRKIAIRLKGDPEARNYMDIALTPVTDGDLDSYEMFTATEAGKTAASSVRKPAVAVAAAATAVAEVGEPFKIVQ